MLEELTVQNYALIDRVSIRFDEGLNVLTGETGAGKSILVGALSLLHGAKADTGNIRTGAAESLVSGVFSVRENEEAKAWLAERDIPVEDGEIIVRRTVKRQGRGTIYVQSAPITRGDLEVLAGCLFDLHGQHEHQSLMQEERHRSLLDRFGGIEGQVANLTQLFQQVSSLKKRYEKMVSSERERMREIDILKFAVEEIDEAQLKPGEEEELEQERRVLSQHEKLFGLLDELYENTAENRGGALANLRSARQAMDSANQIDTSLSPIAKRLDDVFFELEDVVEEIRNHRQGLEFSPDRLEECESRLALIHRLEKKYGNSVQEVLDYAEEARQQLSDLENWEEDKATLEQEIKEQERELLDRAGEISAKRKEHAEALGPRITEIIRTLGMAKADFQVSVEKRTNAQGRTSCGPYGLDSIAFRISPNPGEPLKPLADIASGGEISRVMLAIKTVLAESDQIPTLIFDEVDAGIGGEVALAVGQHMQSLGSYKQVLCITHLASIAVRADNHLRVEKHLEGERTLTDVRGVDGESRVHEISRMLAGDETGKTSRVHAEELLAKYGRSSHAG